MQFCLHLQVSDVWRSYQLDLINYQNKCKLICSWDELFTKVKEHINSVTAMKLSPFYKVRCVSDLCAFIMIIVALYTQFPCFSHFYLLSAHFMNDVTVSHFLLHCLIYALM